MTDTLSREPTSPETRSSAWGRNNVALLIATLLTVAMLAAIGAQVGSRQAALFVVGLALGMTLYNASFGFTSAWRVLIADGRGRGLRAQMLMLSIAVVLFFPALAAGNLFNQPVEGFVAPVGTSVVVGAFLFGLGMQLGGGCGSGTLYTVGGGSLRMVMTLGAFVVGATVGAAQLHWWASLPSYPPISLIQVWGWGPALLVNLVVFFAVALASRALEKRRHGSLATSAPVTEGIGTRLIRGPWPLAVGAVMLALLNFATLAIAGQPWGITSAFALWGSKLVAATGLVDPARWPFWAADEGATLRASVLADITSVMDIGIMIGAFAAAALARRFKPTARIPLGSALAAVLGGLLLGYGSRLAFGCNIGAFFSGVASGSVHGWVWIVAAFFGNLLGTKLRPLFGLTVERTPTQAEG